MRLSRDEIVVKFNNWLKSWNEHDLKGVLHFIHEDIIFTSWDGKVVRGKDVLKKGWSVWFANHGDFKFILEDLFIDEILQKVTFAWELDWIPFERNKENKQREKRRGVDILTLGDGKIITKETYSKTVIQSNSKQIPLNTA